MTAKRTALTHKEMVDLLAKGQSVIHNNVHITSPSQLPPESDLTKDDTEASAEYLARLRRQLADLEAEEERVVTNLKAKEKAAALQAHTDKGKAAAGGKAKGLAESHAEADAKAQAEAEAARLAEAESSLRALSISEPGTVAPGMPDLTGVGDPPPDEAPEGDEDEHEPGRPRGRGRRGHK